MVYALSKGVSFPLRFEAALVQVHTISAVFIFKGVFLTQASDLAARQREFGGYLVKGFPKLGLPGWPIVSASAVCGNGTRENDCRAVTVGALDHNSQGVLQWRLDRLADLQNYCVKNFGRWDTLEAQAAFTMYETKRDYPALYLDLMAGRKSLDTLTTNFCNFFERPAKATAAIEGRIRYAQDAQALLLVSTSTRPPVSKAAASAGGAVVVVAAAAAGGVQWLGGSWWMTALILVSGAVALFAIWRMLHKNGSGALSGVPSPVPAPIPPPSASRQPSPSPDPPKAP